MSDLNRITQAFAPVFGATASTVVIAATASSGNVALPVEPGSANKESKQCSVFNQSTTVTIFVAFGATSGAAVATIGAGATPGSYPVGPLQTVILTMPAGSAYAAAIGSAAGPTNVYITPGFGR